MKEEDGSDSIAVPLADEKHWDELVIIIAVVCTSHPDVVAIHLSWKACLFMWLLGIEKKERICVYVCFSYLDSRICLHVILLLVPSSSFSKHDTCDFITFVHQWFLVIIIISGTETESIPLELQSFRLKGEHFSGDKVVEKNLVSISFLYWAPHSTFRSWGTPFSRNPSFFESYCYAGKLEEKKSILLSFLAN